jgi:murein DD-endopeptidase MepM/ murein hydrolase activator NlpD
MGRISLKSRRAAQRRRRALAGLAGISLSLVIACWSASAASAPNGPALPVPTPSIPPLPTLPQIPIPTPKPAPPTPTTCPTALPLPILPTPTGCPAIAPPARPGVSPPALPSPPRSPSGAGPAGVAAGSAAGPGAVGAGGLPLASLQQSSLLQLLGLLGTPPNVGVEAPNLEHFGSVSGSGSAVTTAMSPSGGQPSSLAAARPHLPSQLWLALSLSLLVALGLTIFGRGTGRPRIARGAQIAGAPFLLAMVVGAVVSAPASVTLLTPHRFAGAAHAAPPAQAVRVGQVSPLPPVQTVSAASTPGQALLAQVTAFETQVAADQAQIQALSLQAQNQTDQLSGMTQRTSPVDPSGATTTMRAVASSLEWTLQQEYTFYLNTARNPAQARGLVAAAATRSGAVRDAVSYDVQAVQAQLAQEAAIAQAAQSAPGSTVGAPGGLLAPLNGAISQPFGPSALAFEPAVTFNGITYPHFHTGIDIAGPLDAPIHAAADGVVAIAGTEVDNQGNAVGYGNYIVIAHAGRMITLYGHLDQLLVHVGQVVHAGQVIGLEGSTGNSTGPHLHFELHVAGLLTDPAKYLRSQLAAA